MTTRTTMLKLLFLLLPAAAIAQQAPVSALPYDLKLVKQEAESGKDHASFKPSAQVRGMKGLNGVVLWVADDKQSLAAYKGQQLLWQTNVASACPEIIGSQEIRAVVSESGVWVIFVLVGERTFAEIDRETGKVTSVDVQRD